MIKVLNEVYREVAELGKVKSIEPDHRSGSILAMVMVIPGRSEDDITALHGNSFTVNCCESSLSLNDEAHCKGSVTMCRGSLIGHDELETGVDCISCVRCF